MFLILVAVIFAGLAGAGAAMIASRLSGGRLPRWTVPAAAGVAMLAATIASEYAWYARVSASLPDGIHVVQVAKASAPWRPWTYLQPLTTRFVAVDTGSVRPNADDPALRIVDLYLYARWAPVQGVQVAVDCTQGRRADPARDGAGPTIWRDVGPNDPVLRAACADGPPAG